MSNSNTFNNPLELTRIEYNRLLLATGLGCLNGITLLIPGEGHSRKKRFCENLYKSLNRSLSRKMPECQLDSTPLLDAYMDAGNEILAEFASKGEGPIHMILNLAYYCLEKLPLNRYHLERLVKLFDLFEEAAIHPDLCASGDAIMERMGGMARTAIVAKGGAF